MTLSKIDISKGHFEGSGVGDVFFCCLNVGCCHDDGLVFFGWLGL